MLGLERMSESNGLPSAKALDVIKSTYEPQIELQLHTDMSQTREEPNIEQRRYDELVSQRKTHDEQLCIYKELEEKMLFLTKYSDEIKVSTNKLSDFIEKNSKKVTQLTKEISESTTKMEEHQQQLYSKTAEIARIQEERDTDKARFRQLMRGIQESTSQLESLKLAYTEKQQTEEIERNSLQANQGQLDSIKTQLTTKIDAVKSLEATKKGYQTNLERSTLLASKVLELNKKLDDLKELKTKKTALGENHTKVDDEVKSMEEDINSLENLCKFSKEEFDQAPLDQKLEHLEKIIDTFDERGIAIQELKGELVHLANELIHWPIKGLVSTSKEGQTLKVEQFTQEMKAFHEMKEYLKSIKQSFIDNGLVTKDDIKTYKEEELKERVISTEKYLIASQKRLKLYDRLASHNEEKKKEALKFVEGRLLAYQRQSQQIPTVSHEEMPEKAMEYLKLAFITLNAQKAARYERSLQTEYHYTTTERKFHELLPKLEGKLTDHLKTVKDAKNQKVSERSEINRKIQYIAEQANSIFPSLSKEKLDAKIKRCESSILTQQIEKERLEKQLAKKQQSITSIKDGLEEATVKQKKERANVQELESQESQLQQEVARHTSTLESIVSEKQQLEKEVKNLGKAIQKLDNEQKLVTLDNEQSIICQFMRYEDQISRMNSEKDNLYEKICIHQRAIDQIKDERKIIYLEIKQLEDSIQPLMKQQRNKNKQIEKDQQFINSTEEVISKAEQGILSNEQKRKEAGEKLDVLKREIEKLNSEGKQYNETASFQWNGKTVNVPARKVGYFDEQSESQIGMMTQEGQLIGCDKKLIYLYSHFLSGGIYSAEPSRSTSWSF